MSIFRAGNRIRTLFIVIVMCSRIVRFMRVLVLRSQKHCPSVHASSRWIVHMGRAKSCATGNSVCWCLTRTRWPWLPHSTGRCRLRLLKRRRWRNILHVSTPSQWRGVTSICSGSNAECSPRVQTRSAACRLSTKHIDPGPGARRPRRLTRLLHSRLASDVNVHDDALARLQVFLSC